VTCAPPVRAGLGTRPDALMDAVIWRPAPRST